jgi:site-specific recombinase XerD
LRSTCSEFAKIYVHISVDGDRTDSPFSTGIKIKKSAWNKKTDRLHDIHAAENQQIVQIEAEIKMQAAIFRTKGVDFSAESLKKALFKETKFVSFFELISKYLKYLGEKNEIAATTLNTRKIRSANILRFLTEKNYKHLGCEEIKPKIMDELQIWLKNNLKSCGDAYLHRHLQFVNSVINYGVLYEYAEKNPLQHYKLPKINKKQKVVYLTVLEQELLAKAVFSDKKLEQVRDIFIFSTCLGLACVDRICFDFEKHTYLKDDGSRWFSMLRNKSGIAAEMPLPNRATEILKKYDFKLPSVADNQNIAVENQLTNRYLKIIMEILGIKKHVTTHTARKTACTNWLRAGVNENVIAAMMGWTSTKMLKIYAEVENETIAKEVKLKLS